MHVMMAPMTWRGVAKGVAVLAAMTTLAGCSWRLETEPEAFRTPSPVTIVRDQLAAAEGAVESAASAGDDALAQAERDAAPVRVAALGGVSPTSAPRAADDLEAAIASARDAALACMGAAGDDPLAGLCASIALSHEVMSTAADPLTIADAGYGSGPDTLPGADTEVSTAELSELALAHDQLGALYEVVAARGTDGAREVALTRSASERARAKALLAIDGVSDLTQPQYDIPTDAGAPLAAELTIAQRYAAALVDAAPRDRLWLYNSAVAAYAQAIVNGLAPGDVPALPGATTVPAPQ